MPVLAQLQTEYGDQGLRVLAVNIDSRNYTLAEWREFVKRFEPNEFIGLAQSGSVQDVTNQAIQAYQLKALGTQVIVDRQGRVAFRRDGPVGYEKLRSEIEKVL